MKIKFSVIESESCNHHVERIIDTYDYQGIIADINKVLDLRELGTESHKLKSAFIAGHYSCADVPPHDHADSCGRCLGCLTHTFVEPKPKEPECECPQDPPGAAHHMGCPRYVEPKRDFSPHKKVMEYDGAYKCYACGKMWGAISSPRPDMPATCVEPIEPKDMRIDKIACDGTNGAAGTEIYILTFAGVEVGRFSSMAEAMEYIKGMDWYRIKHG